MSNRRTYTKEFKLEAIELVDKIGNTAQAELDLGIPNGQIYKWRKAVYPANYGNRPPVS